MECFKCYINRCTNNYFPVNDLIESLRVPFYLVDYAYIYIYYSNMKDTQKKLKQRKILIICRI